MNLFCFLEIDTEIFTDEMIWNLGSALKEDPGCLEEGWVFGEINETGVAVNW